MIESQLQFLAMPNTVSYQNYMVKKYNSLICKDCKNTRSITTGYIELLQYNYKRVLHEQIIMPREMVTSAFVPKINKKSQ